MNPRCLGGFVVGLVAAAALPCQGANKTWNQSGGGAATNPAYWNPAGVPGAADNAILPNLGVNYTVTTDATWAIDDLEIGRYATGHVNGFNLAVDGGGDIYGTLHVQNATYTPRLTLSLWTSSSNGNGTLRLTNGIIAGNINTSASSQIFGSGTINEAMANNDGLIRAEGGVLNISLSGNDHDGGTLSAATGGTLSFGATSNLTNRATIDLQGGTLAGYQYYTYNLINYDSSTQVTGNGTLDRFYLQNNVGAVLAPSGGTLTLAKGFAGNRNDGSVNLATGGTLAVGQAAWANYGAITMTGGAITGQTLQQVQSHTLSVTAGNTNAIQNVSFTAPYGAALSNGATLSITGTGTLTDSTVRSLTGGGKFAVAAGGLVQGRGTVEPAMDIGGTLSANSNGATLTVSGATTVLAGGTAKAESGGTLSLTGNLANRGEVKALGGMVTATGTILAATDATGDFSAVASQLNLSGATFQTGVRNTLTASSGGTITLPGGLSTADLWVTDALRPRGGTLTVPNETTLTHGAGKNIAGYGQLLETGRSLVNLGTVQASGGTLTVAGATANSNAMLAVTGGTLGLAGTLANNGQVYTSGSGAVVIDDAAPTGTGTFTANSGGIIRLADGFTNVGLTTPNALQLAGGTLALGKPGSMTNETGKVIRGYGTLLESGQSLTNNGLLEAAGALAIVGAVTNSGNTIRASAAGDSLNFSGGLTNSGLVEIGPGATLSASVATNTGRISLDQASMTVPSAISLLVGGHLDDNGRHSQLTVHGDLINVSTAADQFEFAHSGVSIYNPFGFVGMLHQVAWGAANRGAELTGFDLNMALGSLTFGDGLGIPNGDTFRLTGDTTIYCYGLSIRQDASLDLGGRTVYFLRDGVEYNGIRGTGFLQEGSYKNGNIIEVVPEPATGTIIGVLVATAMLGRRRSRAVSPDAPPYLRTGQADFPHPAPVDEFPHARLAPFTSWDSRLSRG